MTEKTDDQKQQDINTIAAGKNKNERLSWKRKYDKLQEMIEHEIKPLEELILKTVEKKMEAMDRLDELRKQMVKECIHPKDLLVHKETYVDCKFCNCKLSLPK